MGAKALQREVVVAIHDETRFKKYILAVFKCLEEGRTVILSSPIHSYKLFDDVRQIFDSLKANVGGVDFGYYNREGIKVPIIRCRVESTGLFDFSKEYDNMPVKW